MAVTSYKYAGTVSGSGWTNPDYAKVDDTDYATYALIKFSFTSVLILTNYGFSSSDIPAYSTIDGIEIVMVRFSVSGIVADAVVKIYNDGIVGNNLAKLESWNGAVLYGGATEKWGATLTQENVVANTFGVSIEAKEINNADATAGFDSAAIRVYYTAGEAPSGQPASKRFGGIPFATLRNGIWCL